MNIQVFDSTILKYSKYQEPEPGLIQHLIFFVIRHFILLQTSKEVSSNDH